MPHIRFIGYDTDETMVARASRKAPWAEFYSNWDDIHVDPAKTIVNLSSVLHEVYHYCAPGGIELFWNRLCTPGFAYITIRDMFKPQALPCGDIWREKVIAAGLEEKLRDFESCWGCVRNTNDMIHFLLKYRYTENWEREVKENYMPITPDVLKKRLANYTVMYQTFEPLPYIVHQVQQDIGLDVHHIPTHLKIIFRNTKEYAS